MESSNLLFIIGFLILAVASGDGRVWNGVDRFIDDCKCSVMKGEDECVSVKCLAPKYWAVFTDATEKYSFSLQVFITGDVSKIPSNAFSPFDNVSEMLIIQKGDQKKQPLDWHKDAFSNVTVQALRIHDLSHAIPPPDALKPLGENGLKVLGFYRGGEEIVYLKAGSFSSFRNLEELTIFETTISGIDNAAFDGLENLTSLDLRSCSLESFPAASTFPSLKELWLKDNKISSLENVQFPNSITYLRLENNPITTIDLCKWPAKLETLNLDNTALSKVDLSNFEGTKLSTLFARHIPTLKVLKATKLPEISEPSYYYFSNTSLEEIDPSIERVLASWHSGFLDIENNKKLICDSKINWMARRVQRPYHTVGVDNSVCANGNKLVETYLEEILKATSPWNVFWGIFQKAGGVDVGNVV